MTAVPPNPRRPNKLIHEKSPYLQQHAYNPVDWHPWNEETLALARSSNKPIFLSIGYATCHWCHVMEHESFENEDIARLMNEHFINVKVDREERPDLDAIYMTAVQALTGAGGWPMSVWLTPDLRPFYGGTYFPPENRYGRPGFPVVLTQLSQVWNNERDRVAEASGQIASLLEQAARAETDPQEPPPAEEALGSAVTSLHSMFDPTFGGFGPAPKFPMPVYLDLLVRAAARTGNPEALEMADFTVRRMAQGGLYDQLGGGFARYSTDEKWVVPHFEKMLYDNAQLVSVIASLHAATGDSFHARLLRHTLDYVLRDLRHPQGAFFSAEDADSEGKEGTFYLWTLNEARSVLGDDANLAIDRYGLTVHGNFMDPHTRETGQNVLVQNMSIEELTEKTGHPRDEIEGKLADIDRRLFEKRLGRPRPLRDEKILTEWNGLMISGLVRAGLTLDEPAYLEAAASAVRFLEEHLYDKNQDVLYRRWRDGDRKIEGHQADYAFLIAALLDLFEATGHAGALAWAVRLQSRHDALFFDGDKGGYFMSEPRPDLLVRMKDDGDNVIPSGNSAAVWNGLRLARITGDESVAAAARKTLRFFAKRLKERPVMLASMVGALLFERSADAQIVVLGPLGRDDTRKMLKAARDGHRGDRVVIPVEPGASQDAIGRVAPFIRDMKMLNDRATAYVCVNHACRQPTAEEPELKAQLTALGKE